MAETYEYLGNGWFKFSGRDWLFFISLPEGWHKLKIYVNYTSNELVGGICVVLRNDEVFHAKGWGVGNGRYILTIDRKLVEQASPWGDVRYPGTCDVLEGERCSGYGIGPGKGALEGIKVGWLLVDGSGTMYIKIEVVG